MTSAHMRRQAASEPCANAKRAVPGPSLTTACIATSCYSIKFPISEAMCGTVKGNVVACLDDQPK